MLCHLCALSVPGAEGFGVAEVRSHIHTLTLGETVSESAHKDLYCHCNKLMGAEVAPETPNMTRMAQGQAPRGGKSFPFYQI